MNEDKETFGWLEFATPTATYEQVAAVTSEEAKRAVDRLFNNTPTNQTLRWWENYDGDFFA